MKLISSLLIACSLFSVSAFGITANPTKQNAALKPAFRKDSVVQSPLFRDPTRVRGGAVPGWAAYNDALDKNPLTAKAMTSLMHPLKMVSGLLVTEQFAPISVLGIDIYEQYIVSDAGCVATPAIQILGTGETLCIAIIL